MGFQPLARAAPGLTGNRPPWDPPRQEQLPNRPEFHPRARHSNQAHVQTPGHTVRPVRGTWAHNLYIMCGTCAGADMMIGRGTSLVLRDWGQTCLGAACEMPDNCCASVHRTMSSGTPLRSCLTSPPSTPPTWRRSGLAVSQVVGKWHVAAAE
jgi:hypothetical protein